MEKDVRILIVEDEFMISEDIAMRLSDFGYQVEGTAPSADEAIKILDMGNTDLALIDVNIDGDMDGIGLARIIGQRYHIPFIFLTSLASQSIVEKAKETNPSAYLLKPFNDRQVQIAIEVALMNFSKNLRAETIESQLQDYTVTPPVLSMPDSLFLKKESHFKRVRYDEIFYLSAESNYTLIYTKSGRYVYSTVLKNIESVLPTHLFKRVHRSYIANLEAITGFEGNYLYLGEIKIPVSKSYREELFKSFKIL